MLYCNIIIFIYIIIIFQTIGTNGTQNAACYVSVPEFLFLALGIYQVQEALLP
jgi:hypothetical protein